MKRHFAGAIPEAKSEDSDFSDEFSEGSEEVDSNSQILDRKAEIERKKQFVKLNIPRDTPPILKGGTQIQKLEESIPPSEENETELKEKNGTDDQNISEESSEQTSEDSCDNSSEDEQPLLKPIFIKKKSINTKTLTKQKKESEDREERLDRLNKLYSKEITQKGNETENNLIDDTDDLNPEQEKEDWIERSIRRLFRDQALKEQEELARENKINDEAEVKLRPILVKLLSKRFKKGIQEVSPDYNIDDELVHTISQKVFDELSTKPSITTDDEAEIKKRLIGEVEKYDKSLLPQKFQKTSSDLKVDWAPESKSNEGNEIEVEEFDEPSD